MAFYGRYEDLMIKELDPEEKAIKKGIFATFYRFIELTILVIFGFLALGKYDE